MFMIGFEADGYVPSAEVNTKVTPVPFMVIEPLLSVNPWLLLVLARVYTPEFKWYVSLPLLKLIPPQ